MSFVLFTRRLNSAHLVVVLVVLFAATISNAICPGETPFAPSCYGHGTCVISTCHCDISFGGNDCARQCDAGFTGTACNIRTCSIYNHVCDVNDPDCSVTYSQCGGNSAAHCISLGGQDETCICEGYHMPYCQVRTCINEISNSVGYLESCAGHGTCLSNNQTCVCDEGFAGAWCNHPQCKPFGASPSAVNCTGHGTCTGLLGCTCDDGWLPPYCDTFDCTTNEISGEVCNGNGVCAGGLTPDDPNRCDCDPGYGGNLCDVRSCGSPICSGHGGCVTDIDTGVKSCVCSDTTAFTGLECEVECDCSTVGAQSCTYEAVGDYVCSPSGQCGFQKEAKCNCLSGYNGDFCCQQDFLTGEACSGIRACIEGGHCYCALDSCSGSGVCDTTTGRCECDATNGKYTRSSDYCCPVIDGTLNGNTVRMPCGGRGTCTDQGCQCDDGYEGQFCCHAGCSVHGSCTDDVPSGLSVGDCVCDSGWSGPACDVNGLCASTCDTHGTCLTMPFIHETDGDPLPFWSYFSERLRFPAWNRTHHAVTLNQNAAGRWYTHTRTPGPFNFTIADGVIINNGSGYELMWFELMRGFMDVDARGYDFTYWTLVVKFDTAFWGNGTINFLRFFVNSLQYITFIQTTTLTAYEWAVRSLNILHPDIKVWDEDYLSLIGDNMMDDASGGAEVNGDGAATANRIRGVMAIWAYEALRDYVTGIPQQLPVDPPITCLCDNNQYSGPGCLDVCPHSTNPDYGNIPCVGDYFGEWHGGCDYVADACVCSARWTGPACDQRVVEECFDNAVNVTTRCNGKSQWIPGFGSAYNIIIAGSEYLERPLHVDVDCVLSRPASDDTVYARWDFHILSTATTGVSTYYVQNPATGCYLEFGNLDEGLTFGASLVFNATKQSMVPQYVGSDVDGNLLYTLTHSYAHSTTKRCLYMSGVIEASESFDFGCWLGLTQTPCTCDNKCDGTHAGCVNDACVCDTDYVGSACDSPALCNNTGTWTPGIQAGYGVVISLTGLNRYMAVDSSCTRHTDSDSVHPRTKWDFVPYASNSSLFYLRNSYYGCYMNFAGTGTGSTPLTGSFTQDPTQQLVFLRPSTGGTYSIKHLFPSSGVVGCVNLALAGAASSPTPVSGCQLTLTPTACTCDEACSNNGYCVTDHCVCDTGWTGDTCNSLLAVSQIRSTSVCSDHGTCGATACVCDAGAGGTYCEYFVCSGDSIECNGMGTCQANATCVCDVPTQLAIYAGLQYQPPFLPVGSNCQYNGSAACASYVGGTWRECSNHGHCIYNTTTSSANCVCNNGYAGSKCSISLCGAAGCSINQTCNVVTGVCECMGPRFSPTGCTNMSASCACSANTCGHANLAAGATACGSCSAHYTRDKFGSCSVIQCPLVMMTDSGEVACNSSMTVCDENTAWSSWSTHSTPCCMDRCGTNCFLNNGKPYCTCKPSGLFEPTVNQTDGVCHSYCNGHTGILQGTNQVLTCVCSQSFFKNPVFNATHEYMSTTCQRQTCLNGGVAAGITGPCLCTSRWSGTYCETLVLETGPALSGGPGTGDGTGEDAGDSSSSSSSSGEDDSSTGGDESSTGDDLSSSASETNTSSSSSSSTASSNTTVVAVASTTKLSTGAIIGIAAGSAAFVGLVGIVAYAVVGATGTAATTAGVGASTIGLAPLAAVAGRPHGTAFQGPLHPSKYRDYQNV